MLAGERFGDRPPSVCPVIGAILRVYNDNVDDCRRQDLYRFAADAVDTRRDYAVQRLRADAALEWAIARYESRGGTILSPPDPEGPRDEIAYYVVGALVGRGSRRGRWSDEEHGAIISLLEELIELDRPATLGTSLDDAALDLIVDGPSLGHDTPLIGDLLEHAAESIEHSSGYHEFVLAEGLECGAPERLEPRPALVDQPMPESVSEVSTTRLSRSERWRSTSPAAASPSSISVTLAGLRSAASARSRSRQLLCREGRTAGCTARW